MTFDFLYRTLQSWQQPESACISNCNCYTASVSPVCGSNGVTYLSACFAGCTKPVSWDITADNHCSPVPEGLTININTADLLDISLLHYHLISFCLSEPDQLCVYTQQQRRSSGFTRKVSQPRLSASLPHLPVCYMCVQHDWSYGPDTLCHHPYQVWARPPPLAIHQLLTRGSWRHFKIPVVLQWKGLIYQADSDTDKYRHTQVYINSYIMTNNTKGIICTLCVCVCVYIMLVI